MPLDEAQIILKERLGIDVKIICYILSKHGLLKSGPENLYLCVMTCLDRLFKENKIALVSREPSNEPISKE